MLSFVVLQACQRVAGLNLVAQACCRVAEVLLVVLQSVAVCGAEFCGAEDQLNCHSHSYRLNIPAPRTFYRPTFPYYRTCPRPLCAGSTGIYVDPISFYGLRRTYKWLLLLLSV